MAHATGAMTIKEFCAAYSVGKTLVFKEIKEGRLPARRLGARKRLILIADAEAWARKLPKRA